ncbi:MAG: glycosyltransferase, partial [Bdellovibrionales bacterium]|nr:glycosyltransferase [Bdellovibrionales bacterium]
MKRILVLCPYPENVAPTQRLKYEQYFPHFRQAGYSLTVSPFMSARMWRIVYKPKRVWEKAFWVMAGYLRRLFDLARAPFYDGLYVSLWITPFGAGLFERLFVLANRRVVYDIDDLVFLGKTSTANRFARFLKSPEKYHYLMRAARHVITCTPHLDAYVRK